MHNHAREAGVTLSAFTCSFISDAEHMLQAHPSTCSSSCGSGQPVAHSCPAILTRGLVLAVPSASLTRPSPTVAWLAAGTEAHKELAIYLWAIAERNVNRKHHAL
jgi:hypothetical protein